ncbi:hypothetical protein [Acinetobacter rathckeae]|uniref:hypothetical protein n=1 Tax=Acinetobacter rathckeae TaxID=2605272 RepID=UPI0018A2AEF7|nr:hypothetical protein [Acinetobacter rathckeae]MBF7696640.1 hypothetical protein [Acinetobacter rathckeae]
MKANEFIKSMGLGGIRKLIKNNNIRSENMLIELKILVKSHDLVEKCGGLIPCKKILVARIRHKPNAEYFAVHPEKPNLIQLYRRNEAKLIPNYRFRDLEKAIADVESCQ